MRIILVAHSQYINNKLLGIKSFFRFFEKATDDIQKQTHAYIDYSLI